MKSNLNTRREYLRTCLKCCLAPFSLRVFSHPVFAFDQSMQLMMARGSGGGGGGGGGITILSHGLGPAGSGTTGSIDTTGATGLYIWGAGLNSGITISDSKSNTWTQSTSYSGGADNVVLWYVDAVPTVGTGHTFTLSGSGFFTWGYIVASGMKTSSSFDGTTGNAATGATIQPGSLNPGAGRHLLITVMSSEGVSGTWTGVDLSFAIQDQQDFNGGVNYEGAVATLIQTSGSSVNPTATFNSSTPLVIGLYSFGGV